MFGDDRRVRFAARHAVTLVPFASKEETRYYLTGIHVEPYRDGVLLAATDGHRLGVIYDATGETNGQWICPIPKVLLQAARHRDADKIHLIGRAGYVTSQFFGDDDPAAIGEQHLGVAYTGAIDGTYPNFRRVLPKKQPATSLELNRRYLSEFGGKSIQIFAADPNEPTYVLRSGDAEFVGVQMPLRDASSKFPDWFAPLLEDAEPAQADQAAE